MALSVMLISSGQTRVQHLVMLAEPDSLGFLELREPVLGVERVHLQRRHVGEERGRMKLS